MIADAGAAGAVNALVAAVTAVRELNTDVDDSVRIDLIAQLEELKSAAAAAQAGITAAFAASQRTLQLAQGIPAERASRGIAAQVGLAKRQSPFHATRYVGWSKILTSELPGTFAALRAGAVGEWRAMIVARETAWLSSEHRARVDAAVAANLGGWGDQRVENEVKRLAYRLDPTGYLSRLRDAVGERHVTLRPAPDTMSRLTGVLPVEQGVAAYAALKQHADSLRSSGDPRACGQIMADTLVERITGQAHAADVAVEIQLVMTDASLLGTAHSDGMAGDTASAASAGADEPAQLTGYGPIPAAVARTMIRGAADTTPMWIRRIYRRPGTGDLIAMDSRRRCFPAAQRRFVVVRDQTCRTPWCDAPIRHVDHVDPAANGGPTSVDNGQGYCAACNHTRQAPGWRARPGPAGAGDEVIVTTPTGHRYRSRPPDLPGQVSPPRAA